MNGTPHRRVATTTATTTAPMSPNAGLGSMTYSSTTRPLSSPPASSSSSSSSLSMWDVFLQECRAISAWVVLSAALRIALSDWIRWSDGQPGSFPHEPPAVLKDTARIVLSLLCPSGVAQNQTPGFVFGNGWLLFLIHATFGVYPLLPIRLCETILGRLSIQDLLLVVPVHFGCFLATVIALRRALPEALASAAFEPIVYTNENPWIEDCLREAVVTALFVVGFLVLPTLLKVNKLPPWVTVVLLYPVYGMGVDSGGMGSTFGPNVVYALQDSVSQQEQEQQQNFHRTGGVLMGGLLAGLVMRNVFPDDPKE